MNPPEPQAGHGKPQDAAEQCLAAMLGSDPAIAEARLRHIRSAVFERIAERQEYRLADLLRWKLALPAAFSLLLVGAALGWAADEQLAERQASVLLGPAAAVGDFE